ncbi:MAG: hypothetical protein KGQ44_04165, partial [Betaproteobacteria bacterium]|nr:hypothetical protein [Betaproteobacteria bacterium]
TKGLNNPDDSRCPNPITATYITAGIDKMNWQSCLWLKLLLINKKALNNQGFFVDIWRRGGDSNPR